MYKIRLLHVDDHSLFIEGIKYLISEYPIFEWIGGASSAHQGIEFSTTLKPDLILIDYFIPEKNGIEIGKEILKNSTKSKLVLLTMENSYPIIQEAKQNGFSAWISKASEKEELMSVLEKVAITNEKLFPEYATPSISLKGNVKFDQLTKREKEILLLVTQGFTSQEIADKLFLSLLTVNTHRRNLLSKLGIKNFAQLSGENFQDWKRNI